MTSRIFSLIALVWFFGWGFLLLKFPRQIYRILSFGREPNARNFKNAKIVGYMGLGFGALLLLENIFGLLH
jgi:hypothetical protein